MQEYLIHPLLMRCCGATKMQPQKKKGWHEIRRAFCAEPARVTVAKAMSMILEEDLQKLEFYMVGHEDEIKKFWNIVSAFD